MSAGKGDKPRNCFSKKFKDNYDEIVNWATKEGKEIRNYIVKKGKKIYRYP
jgi:vacuolar-type H+-ATPase subunit H